MNASRSTSVANAPSLPWWRVGTVWLVLAGPALVIVAGFATLALAIGSPDPVLDTSAPAPAAEQPAMQARNHAATPQR